MDKAHIIDEAENINTTIAPGRYEPKYKNKIFCPSCGIPLIFVKRSKDGKSAHFNKIKGLQHHIIKK